MTHDELLVKIDLITWLAEEQMGITGLNIHKALRAVVELHKPQKVSWAGGNDYCDQCSYWKDKQLIEYPCQTIQAIEKEFE